MRIEFNYGTTITPDQMQPGKLYLDGACQGPAVRMDLPAISFDHHAGCLRTFTLATCQQVALALRLGLDITRFETIVANDLDADTMVSLWLLSMADRFGPNLLSSVLADARVIDLVERVGIVDAHGPIQVAHPLHDALTPGPKVEQSRDLALHLIGVLDQWWDEDVVPPSSKGFPPAPWWGVKADGTWIEGAGDFGVAYRAGVVALVVEVPGKDGTIGYTIGKQSEFVSYDIPAFLGRMNVIEPGWGGGSTIGGAPRNPDWTRSRLPRATVQDAFRQR